MSIDLDQVKAKSSCSPRENRLLAVNCSELYQVSPKGAFRRGLLVVNCGNGRKDWATVLVSGKPAKGSLF